MGRIFQTYCLLVASLLVLVVSVFPHHHHEERVCLKSDWYTCAAGYASDTQESHSENSAPHGCTLSCATHFAFEYQQLSRSDVSPDYSFSFLIYPMLSLLEHLSAGILCSHNSDFVYIEKLHSRQWMVASGLRAPPVTFVADRKRV